MTDYIDEKDVGVHVTRIAQPVPSGLGSLELPLALYHSHPEARTQLEQRASLTDPGRAKAGGPAPAFRMV